MSRKHLFVVVVMLGAAAVAGLLAFSRTAQLGAAAGQASSTEIAAKSSSLDRLEASLRRSLANQPPALPSTPHTADRSAPQTVYLLPSTAGRHGDEHDEHDEHEGEDD